MSLAALAGRENMPLDVVIRVAEHTGVPGAHASLKVTAGQAVEISRELDRLKGR